MTEYKNPALTVDAIIENNNQVLMIRRKGETFHGHLALPGGFVDYGETVENAVIREVKEELNADATPIAILGVYSEENRDPRSHIVSIVFVCNYGGELIAGDDASGYEWISLDKLDEYKLAFDHKKVLNDYLQWKKGKGSFWSSK